VDEVTRIRSEELLDDVGEGDELHHSSSRFDVSRECTL
jgi:hypothetical protein